MELTHRADSDRGTRTAVVVAVARSQRERNDSADSGSERSNSDRGDRGWWWRRVGSDADPLITIKYMHARPEL